MGILSFSVTSKGSNGKGPYVIVIERRDTEADDGMGPILSKTIEDPGQALAFLMSAAMAEIADAAGPTEGCSCLRCRRERAAGGRPSHENN